MSTKPGQDQIEICSNDDGSWHYSGVVSVWNEGATDAYGLHIKDTIQNKTGSGQFKDAFTALDSDEPGIPAYTFENTAYTFDYSLDQAPLFGSIRSSAVVTIINHSGSKTNGPNPKATWSGPVNQCTTTDLGCTLTLGYWGTHNNSACDPALDPFDPAQSSSCVIWPGNYDPNALFYSSGLTWLEVLQTPIQANGYFALSHQYIATVLNQAN